MALRDLATTELRNPASADIDEQSTEDICRLINRQDSLTPLAVAETIPFLAQAVDVLTLTLSGGHRVFYVGAGTSGRLGVLDASELLPTFGLEPGRVVALIAGGDGALRHSVEAAEDNPEQGAADLAAYGFSSRDVVVGIAASGRTPYVIGAMEYAKQLGATTIAIVCARASLMAGLADIAIEAVPGPEVITGSTRMKAGTAQKMVLNILSTATMIRLGKVYGNLMVDVQATNEKLRHRAVRIVAEAVGVDIDVARDLLSRAGGEVKVAIVMGLLDVPVDAARERLTAANSVVRLALEL